MGVGSGAPGVSDSTIKPTHSVPNTSTAQKSVSGLVASPRGTRRRGNFFSYCRESFSSQTYKLWLDVYSVLTRRHHF